jgi:phospholipid transport system substrate-binding protein
MTSEGTGWTRRRLLAAAGAATLVLGLPGVARANPQARAEALVAQLSGELLRLITSGRSEAQLYAEFERILARYGDMPAVAASVVGPPWRGATGSQQQQFVAVFQSYLSRKYGRQFRDFQRADIGIVRSRDAGTAGVLVQTRISRPGQQDLAVDWQVSERSGQPRVVNLMIEGVSMLANERAEMAALLEAQRGSLDGLIRALQARA